MHSERYAFRLAFVAERPAGSDTNNAAGLPATPYGSPLHLATATVPLVSNLHGLPYLMACLLTGGNNDPIWFYFLYGAGGHAYGVDRIVHTDGYLHAVRITACPNAATPGCAAACCGRWFWLNTLLFATGFGSGLCLWFTANNSGCTVAIRGSPHTGVPLVLVAGWFRTQPMRI